MATITLNGFHYLSQDKETVLDTLLREGIAAPYGCKAGACQACLMRSLDGKPPAIAQQGLKDTLQHRNYFLACQCYPDQDIRITFPHAETFHVTATVVAKETLTADIVRLYLAVEGEFEFLAGQFVNLSRADGLTRSYSIANPSSQGRQLLEFHIRRLPEGQFSNWIFDELANGTELTISEAKGNCYYLPGQPEQPLLLVGTGSGLAPLYGIVKDALQNGHVGPIHLYHGSRHPDGLYLVDEMRQLSEKTGNFRYVPCLSRATQLENFVKGRAHEVALAENESLNGWKVFLCGHPEMVNKTKLGAYLKGASMDNIYTDAFHAAT